MFLFRIRHDGGRSMWLVKNMTNGTKSTRHPHDYSQNRDQQIEQILCEQIKDFWGDPTVPVFVNYIARDAKYVYYVAKTGDKS